MSLILSLGLSSVTVGLKKMAVARLIVQVHKGQSVVLILYFIHAYIQAMEKRIGDASGDLAGTSQPPPFSDPPSSQGGRKKKRGKQRRSGKKSPVKEEEKKEVRRGSKKEKRKKRLSSPSQSVIRLVHSIEVIIIKGFFFLLRVLR